MWTSHQPNRGHSWDKIAIAVGPPPLCPVCSLSQVFPAIFFQWDPKSQTAFSCLKRITGLITPVMKSSVYKLGGCSSDGSIAVDLNFLCVKFTGSSDRMSVPLLCPLGIFSFNLSPELPKSQHHPLGWCALTRSFLLSTTFSLPYLIQQKVGVETVFMNCSDYPPKKSVGLFCVSICHTTLYYGYFWLYHNCSLPAFTAARPPK